MPPSPKCRFDMIEGGGAGPDDDVGAVDVETVADEGGVGESRS